MPSRGVKLFGLLGAGLLAGLGLGYGAARRRTRGPQPRRVRVPDPHLGPRTGRHMGGMALIFLALVLFAGAATSAYLFVKRSHEADVLAARLTQGNPKRGPQLALHYGCAGCHDIPGIRGPRGKVGPPLGEVGARIYLGGRIANTPDNLVQWIVNPREVDPKTAMPVTGISKREARDVAAYLLTLR
jgi:cytochrome c2